MDNRLLTDEEIKRKKNREKSDAQLYREYYERQDKPRRLIVEEIERRRRERMEFAEGIERGIEGTKKELGSEREVPKVSDGWLSDHHVL